MSNLESLLAFNSYFESHLIQVGLEITSRCNQKCIYCCAPAEVCQHPEPDSSTLRERICRLAKGEPRNLLVTGGEPFLRKDLFELCQFAVDQGINSITIASNGMLIDRRLAGLLARQRIGVVLSLDTIEPTLFDSLRGTPGAYQAVVRAMSTLGDADVATGVNIVISSVNYDRVAELLEFLVDRKIQRISVQRLFARGRAANRQDLWLSPAMLRTAYSKISECETKLGVHIAWGDPLGLLMDETRAARNRRAVEYCLTKASKCYLPFGCTAGKSIGIMLNGDVRACFHLTLTAGNIDREELKDICETELVLRLKDRGGLTGKCRRCRNKYICGGCRVSSLLEHGDYLGDDPLCWQFSRDTPASTAAANVLIS